MVQEKEGSLIIPQIILDYEFDGEKVAFLPMYMSTTLNEQSVDDFPLELNKNLLQFFRNKKMSWKLVHMPFETRKHFINIG